MLMMLSRKIIGLGIVVLYNVVLYNVVLYNVEIYNVVQAGRPGGSVGNLDTLGREFESR